MKKLTDIAWKSNPVTLPDRRRITYPTNTDGILFKLIDYYENTIYKVRREKGEDVSSIINTLLEQLQVVCDYPKEKDNKDLLKQLNFPKHINKLDARNVAERRRMYNNFARTLFLYFDIPLSVFGLPEIKSENRIEMITDLSYERPIQNHGTDPRLPELHRGKETLKKVEQDFVDRYLASVLPILEKVKSSLLIYEFVGKGAADNDADFLLAYSVAHTQVFAKIEARVSNEPKMVYRRLLAFPFAEKVSLESDESELIGRFLKLCTHSCFAHIVRCLQLDNDIEVSGSGDNRFTSEDSNSGFHLVPLSRRDYHFALIDDHYILSEYYKYSKTKKGKKDKVKPVISLHCVPDIMFIERNEGSLGVLYKKYEQDFINLTKSSIRLRSLDALKAALDALIETTEYDFGNSQLENANYMDLNNLLTSLRLKREIYCDLMV